MSHAISPNLPLCPGDWIRDGWTEIDTPEDWALIYPRWICRTCGREMAKSRDPATGDRAYMIDPEGRKQIMGAEE